MRASLSIALLALMLVPACEGVVRFPGDEAGDNDPCAARDEDDCGSDAACQPLYLGNTCEGEADYNGCVTRTRIGCTEDAGCGSGATCEVLELGVCAGPPEAVTCLACGAAETGVCSR